MPRTLDNRIVSLVVRGGDRNIRCVDLHVRVEVTAARGVVRVVRGVQRGVPSLVAGVAHAVAFRVLSWGLLIRAAMTPLGRWVGGSASTHARQRVRAGHVLQIVTARWCRYSTCSSSSNGCGGSCSVRPTQAASESFGESARI